MDQSFHVSPETTRALEADEARAAARAARAEMAEMAPSRGLWIFGGGLYLVQAALGVLIIPSNPEQSDSVSVALDVTRALAPLIWVVAVGAVGWWLKGRRKGFFLATCWWTLVVISVLSLINLLLTLI